MKTFQMTFLKLSANLFAVRDTKTINCFNERAPNTKELTNFFLSALSHILCSEVYGVIQQLLLVPAYSPVPNIP